MFDEPQGLAVISTGAVVFGGYLTSTFTAGSKSISNSNHDGFVVGLSNSGSVNWVEKVGGSQFDYVFDLASNGSDYVGHGFVLWYDDSQRRSGVLWWST